MKRITLADVIQLPPKKANFVVEYVRDFAARRAAEVPGYSADHGYVLLKDPEVLAAIEYVVQQRLEVNHIDADWLLMELVDNHQLARQQGNITASNTALGILAKHTRVDALASDKLNVNIATDEKIMERLRRGRERAVRRQGGEKDVSFM